MLSKFFKPRIRKGQPISGGNVRRGLSAMDHAWATLDVLGGHVDWSHGRPTIVAPGGTTADTPPQLFDVIDDEGTYKIYVPDAEKVSAVMFNGFRSEHPYEGTVDVLWRDIIVGEGDKLIVVTNSNPQEDEFTSGGSWIVEAVALDGSTGEPPDNDSNKQSKVIAQIKGGVLSQLYSGAINIDMRGGDAEIDYQSASTEYHSIERKDKGDGKKGEFEVNAFEAGTGAIESPALQVDEDYVEISMGGDKFARQGIMIRQRVEFDWKVRYLGMKVLMDYIRAAIDDDYDNMWGYFCTLFENGELIEPHPDFSCFLELLKKILTHSNLKDIDQQNVLDDHRGGRVAAASVSESNIRHPYIHANGDATRNSMTDTSRIGDADNEPSIGASVRKLFAVISGTAVTVLDWAARKLEGGQWTVTDETSAHGPGGATSAALRVKGGIFAEKGIEVYANDDENRAGGFLYEGIQNLNYAELGTPSAAVFTLGNISIDEDSGVFQHNANDGVTIANWTSGGIVYGDDIEEIDAEELLPTDKILVRRAAP